MSVRRRCIAITGAGGFIGREVCRELSVAGCEIRALSGPAGSDVVTPVGVTFDVRADVRDRTAVVALLDGGVDALVHLAGPPSVRASFEDPLAFAEAHVGGTANILAVCRERGVQKIVYVSSAEVYGRPIHDPVDENHPLDARSPYAAAKIGAEQMVRAFDRATGSASTILRPFSVYGRNMGAHAVIPAILRQIDGTGSLRLIDLRPERDYCHVGDIARGIASAVNARHAQTTAINLGSGVGTSVGDLARLLVRLSGRDREIQDEPTLRRPADAEILRLVADRQRAADILGWTPRITLNQGLRSMLDTLREPA